MGKRFRVVIEVWVGCFMFVFMGVVGLFVIYGRGVYIIENDCG